MTGRQIDARLAELRPHPQNYNKHSEAQIGRLMQSLETFGQPKPIVIWRGLIIAGHGRVEAAQRLKWERLLASDMSEEWTEAQATAFVGADNELARLADPDEAALAQLAASLADVDRDLAALAAGTDERLRELMASLQTAQAGDDPGAQVDKAAELREKWGVEPGQLWQLGEHRLICGDCTDREVVARVMGGEKADAVVTDPPYGIGWERGTWDDDPAKYKDLMLLLVEQFNWVTGNGPVFVWQALQNLRRFHEWFPADFRVLAACKGFVQFRPTAVQWSWDPVVFWGDFGNMEPSVYRKDFHVNNLAPFGAKREKVDHPSPKSVPQTEYVIELASQANAVIYEPFSGSGTTLLACERLGRRARCVEIEPGYVAVALERWATMTGKTPVLVS